MALRATKIHENPGRWRTSGEQAQGFSTLRRVLTRRVRAGLKSAAG
jgi:hypothetical protein